MPYYDEAKKKVVDKHKRVASLRYIPEKEQIAAREVEIAKIVEKMSDIGDEFWFEEAKPIRALKKKRNRVSKSS